MFSSLGGIGLVLEKPSHIGYQKVLGVIALMKVAKYAQKYIPPIRLRSCHALRTFSRGLIAFTKQQQQEDGEGAKINKTTCVLQNYSQYQKHEVLQNLAKLNGQPCPVVECTSSEIDDFLEVRMMFQEKQPSTEQEPSWSKNKLSIYEQDPIV
ncbi:hypothetical protein KEM54_000665 [Ascosphaera aggregata]|nr:hypothetical protein KEM54_000665 [Ascosphaera aggregata]